MAELVDKELQRDPILKPIADRGCEGIHQAGNRRTFLGHRDEDFARRAILIQADRDVPFVTADRKLVSKEFRSSGSLRRTGR